VSLTKGGNFVDRLATEFAGIQPRFENLDKPHCVADLDLPIYITTNYDDFMLKALEAVGKHPIRELLSLALCEKPEQVRVARPERRCRGDSRSTDRLTLKPATIST
jgi:hypothetical protein